MPIITRDLDSSVKRESFSAVTGAAATGATALIINVPYACNLDYVAAAAFGVSNVPTVLINCSRFIAGVGSTVFPIGSTSALVNFGTSGPVVVPGGTSFLVNGISVPVMGSTLATLFAGDVLSFQLGGTNAAVTGLTVNAVLRPISDIVKYYSVV